MYGRISRLLAAGKTSPEVCYILRIQREREKYHRRKALRDGVIRRTKSKKPYLYEKGANFYRVVDGGSGRNLPTVACRVHAHGNAFKAIVRKLGDYTLATELGSVLANERPGRLCYELPVPNGIRGDGARDKATLIYYEEERALSISPPDLLLTEIEDEPYAVFFRYLNGVLEGRNGWRLEKSVQCAKDLHYAFDHSLVLDLNPYLLDGVPYLTRGTDEAQLVIYVDKSHGHLELETTERDIACDILAVLSVEAKSLRGP